MADELKDQRIPIMMSPSEVKAIDDWMFSNRIKSRAEAIRRLCQLGLILNDKLPATVDDLFKIAHDIAEYGTSENIDLIKSQNSREKLFGVTDLLEKLFVNISSVADNVQDMQAIHRLMSIRDLDLTAISQLDRKSLDETLQLIREKRSALPK